MSFCYKDLNKPDRFYRNRRQAQPTTIQRLHLLFWISFFFPGRQAEIEPNVVETLRVVQMTRTFASICSLWVQMLHCGNYSSRNSSSSDAMENSSSACRKISKAIWTVNSRYGSSNYDFLYNIDIKKKIKRQRQFKSTTPPATGNAFSPFLTNLKC